MFYQQPSFLHLRKLHVKDGKHSCFVLINREPSLNVLKNLTMDA